MSPEEVITQVAVAGFRERKAVEVTRDEALAHIEAALAIHKPSTLTEDVWYEDCDRDGCDTSKGCNGHETVVCDSEECWAIGEDGDALPNPYPCETARVLGVVA